MVKIQAMSSFDHYTSFFLDQPQPQKWNGLPDLKKKKLGTRQLKQKTTTKDFNRLCSVSSKLTASFYVVSFLLLKRKNENMFIFCLTPFQVEKDKVHSNVVIEYSVCVLWEYTTLSFLHNVVSTRKNTFDYPSKGLT